MPEPPNPTRSRGQAFFKGLSLLRPGLRVLAVLSCALLAVPAVAVELRDEAWVTNGPVHASAVSPDRTILYLGGEFTYLGPVSGGAAALDAGGTGVADFGFPRVNGPVHAAVADGSGGWFIGGAFSRVGAQARANLAHIDAARQVTAWNPPADGPVRALALAGEVLYIGGEFTRIGGGDRNRLAAVSAADGALTAWNPGADGAVLALQPGGAVVYAGGEFSQIGGAARNRIAALDAASGSATAWNPDANGAVRALALSGATLYAGGDFTAIDGGGRAHLAALDTTQTAAGAINTGWAPAPDGAVHALLLDGTRLYAGGAFTSVEGLARNRLAALDTTRTSAITDTAWDPSAGGTVETLALAGGVLYAGGEFASVNGVTRRNLAALDLATGAATAWDPDANGAVRVLLWNASGNTLYAGGDFTAIAGQTRGRLAAVSAASGAVTAWNPGADGPVHALAPSFSGGSMYVGGTFTAVGGLPRDGLGEIALANGVATSWNPAPAGGVYALAVDGSTLYVGGDFAAIDGAARDRLAAFDMRVPVLLDWAPRIDDGSVLTLLYIADSGVLYAAGDFTVVAGASRTGVVALDPRADDPLVWNPGLNGAVRALVRSFDRTLLYAGGDFTAVAGLTRTRVAALAVADGTATSDWEIALDAPVNTLALVNDTTAGTYTLYAGGGFATVDGGARPALAALAALPPEQVAPETTAVPAGGLYNSTTAAPIALVCSDNAGSGCATTYYTTDGAEPTTASPVYNAAIPLNADLVLKFFSVDHAGNAGTVRTETYSVELNPPLTRATPATRVFDANSIRVTLSCDDGPGTGCAATYYTLDGSSPNTASPRYTGPITIRETTVLKFFSVDAAGNAEGVKREEYAKTQGKVGALALFEMLVLAAGLWLRTRRGVTGDGAA